MSQAFELLKPGVRAEEKTATGLDPAKDYTKDAECLPCHVTGWGQPGGYAIPQEGSSPEAIASQQLAERMVGVQCEVCHGKGSEHARDGSFGRGLLMEKCNDCHDEENSPDWDAEVYWRMIEH